MPEYPQVLLEKAFKVIPGEHYNRYHAEAKSSTERDKLFYEVSLLEERPWSYLRDRVYPSFARYLKDKSMDPESGEGVVVAVFWRDRCYLLRGNDFIKAFKEMEGLSSSAFHFRILQWLSCGT